MLRREQSWSIGIDEFFKRKREEGEIEMGDGVENSKKSNWTVKSAGKEEGVEELLKSLIEEVKEMRRELRAEGGE